MHEFSLVQSLLDQVESIRLAERAERVLSIRVNVGEFSGVEPDLVRDAFDMLVEATPTQGAELDIITTPLKARCRDCGGEFYVEHFFFECPTCYSRDIMVIQGEGVILETVELELDS
ncbi:MAG: hydrogenase maturation nickel metallochaperone HypA [Pirellulales bacterium]|nr:hydrogenase maturation nickel metallochaperone HypA [Pirellulales bacterium]